MAELELEQRETQVSNQEKRLKAEKRAFEEDPKERLLREIQVQQIEVEDKKKEIANREADLDKEKRLLEKQQELLQSDREEMKRKWQVLDEEREKFEEQHRVIKQTSEKLNFERERILNEKSAYETDLEAYLKNKRDIDFQFSVVHSEQLRIDEMDQELRSRQKMLNLFQFSKGQDADLTSMPFYQLGFGNQNIQSGSKQLLNEHI